MVSIKLLGAYFPFVHAYRTIGLEMNLTNNTRFITGGSWGIGQGLAEAFHRLGNHVILGGRRRDALDAVDSVAIDTASATSVEAAAVEVLK